MIGSYAKNQFPPTIGHDRGRRGAAQLRGHIERNATALLSNYDKHPVDPPTHSWLGRHCNREKVRNSGLWNSNHVDERYDAAFLDTLARQIDRMENSE